MSSKIVAVVALGRMLREQQTTITTNAHGNTTIIRPVQPMPSQRELQNFVEDIMKLGADEERKRADEAREQAVRDTLAAVTKAVEKATATPKPTQVWVVRDSLRYITGIYANQAKATHAARHYQEAAQSFSVIP